MNLADGASIKDNKKDDYMNQVLQLMDRFSDSDMTKLQVEVEGFKVSLQRETKEMIEVAHAGQLKTVDMVPINQTQIVSVNPETIECTTSNHGKQVKAPLVGTFYSSNEPGGKPFVSVGDTVKKGQPLCIIEAMKVMNEIESPYEGVVKEIKVQNEEAVGFDQLLMILE
ncbi:acetyl-CoA carboxylase biotin carboxyl carrier protein [Turicibacter sp. TJ11]|uniref:acetyl-CoA carboxylase biotin carboxyl carrier protein n=1 Tax=Turicibacter sp. TJ11 TaxID=2806443 RepID=UPI001F475781|nr:acetyl-CoA carboxylase biotin carboxyl carrier protein [Turicibacter sp. TJ11]